MRRTSIMTLGFVLVFLGLQLSMVESYHLTPRFSNFLSENGGMMVSQTESGIQPYNSPYYQASYPGNVQQAATNLTSGSLKTIITPPWLCWPVVFLGAVVFLHGFAKR